MKVIGLTGGIGSGKSTVSQYLAELGAVIIDADKVTHEVLNPDNEIGLDVITEFGQDIVTPEGNIDRKKLAEIVFNNLEALSRLSQIMHPRMYQIVKDRLEEYRRQNVNIVVLEVIALIEANWTPLVDEVWVTVADEDTIIDRLKKQRGLSEQEILQRIHSQMPSEERVKHADVVISNNGSIDELKARIRELWQRLC